MKFKCKATSLVYNFEYEVDILAMKNHPDYESVPDNEEVAETPVKTSKKSKVTSDNETSIDG